MVRRDPSPSLCQLSAYTLPDETLTCGIGRIIGGGRVAWSNSCACTGCGQTCAQDDARCKELQTKTCRGVQPGVLKGILLFLKHTFGFQWLLVLGRRSSCSFVGLPCTIFGGMNVIRYGSTLMTTKMHIGSHGRFRLYKSRRLSKNVSCLMMSHGATLHISFLVAMAASR